MNAVVENGVIQAFNVPEELFGYSYHSLMIPPYPVKTALFLGWGEGNVAWLMDKIWPVGTEMVGVDLKESQSGRMPSIFFPYSAETFVKQSETTYDFVCIDLYKGKKIPDFVFEDEFIKNVARITGKLLAINYTFYGVKELGGYGNYFIPDAIKSVNSDKVIFMVPKRIFEVKH